MPFDDQRDPIPFVPPVWENKTRTPSLKITNVKAILTAPQSYQLVVVKVETNDPTYNGSAAPGIKPAPLP